MPGLEESLFSLELVIEKVYIPHVTCRFPAVAFRLLDFPTILISHVDADLAKTIKTKITRDPYYTIPDQFAELKDEHGNFMMKKGKSCLFKIPVETLKMHLANTPLYVMVIDTYPDNPKLIGNSTVPLNSLMDNICVDIARLGTTVPSVQGDKGLFKVYSLMGKEIGYFVLGFRLLCLGPGLIPHLPEAALSKQIPMKQTEIQSEDETDSKIIHVAEASPSKGYRLSKQARETSELNDTREMGSMTDVEKHDVILQTMELNDKAVHVAISDVENKIDKCKCVTISTQTEKHKKAKQKLNERKKYKEQLKEEEDDIVANEIICPPPMFYNSKASPKVKMQKYLHRDYSDSDDLTIEDLESVDEQGDNNGIEFVVEKRDDSPRYTWDKHSAQKCAKSPGYTHQVSAKNVNISRQPSRSSSPSMFPVLTALLNELTGIQSAPFLESVARLTHGKQQPVQANVRSRSQVAGPRPVSQRIVELSQPRQPLVKDRSVKEEADISQTRDVENLKTYDRGRKSYRQCAKPQPGVPRHKGWLRQVPEGSVKKSQLIFRLTHTQRLRLAKTNPDWLKAIEKEESELKKKKEQATKKAVAVDSDVDLNATNLSDTLTEVRRLAQRELSRGDGTMNTTKDVTATFSDMNASLDLSRQSGQPGSPSRGKRWLTRYGRRSPSPRHRSVSPKRRLHSPKSRNQSKLFQQKARKQAGASVDTDEVSQRSDQRSIEVHLPSAQMDDDDDRSDMTLDDRDAISEDGRGEDDDKIREFTKGEESFPDSIHGQPDGPLSDPRDDDQPLESTRLSTNLKESSEYDTRQFMSTDEPELQNLISEDEDRSERMDSGRHGRLSGAVVSASIASSIHKFPVVNPVASEQSPVPATRRSTVKLDLGPSREPTPQPDTPRSQGSSKKPTPRPRRPVKLGRESVHTDSVSSYQPSDPDNAMISLSSDMNYSDDFHPAGSDFEESLTDISSPDFLNPRVIPSTKLGYTIS